MLKQVPTRVGGFAPINYNPKPTVLAGVSPSFGLRPAKMGDPPRHPTGFPFPPHTSPVGQKVIRARFDLHDEKGMSHVERKKISKRSSVIDHAIDQFTNVRDRTLRL